MLLGWMETLGLFSKVYSGDDSLLTLLMLTLEGKLAKDVGVVLGGRDKAPGVLDGSGMEPGTLGENGTEPGKLDEIEMEAGKLVGIECGVLCKLEATEIDVGGIVEDREREGGSGTGEGVAVDVTGLCGGAGKADEMRGNAEW